MILDNQLAGGIQSKNIQSKEGLGRETLTNGRASNTNIFAPKNIVSYVPDDSKQKKKNS